MTSSDEHDLGTDREPGQLDDAQVGDGQPDDDWPALAAELRAVFDAIDPVPPEVEAVAYGALAWRDVESALAELVADSAESGQLAGVRRSGSAPRVVTFEAPGVVIEVEVTETGRTRSLIGQLVPTGTATVEVHTPDDATTVDADELGRFALDDVSAGPVRLTCLLDDRRVVTSWTTV